MAVARDVMIKGAATIAHETTPSFTPHKASKTTTPMIPTASLIPATTNIPNEMSRAIWIVTNNK